jgi:hypothetical protein
MKISNVAEKLVNKVPGLQLISVEKYVIQFM